MWSDINPYKDRESKAQTHFETHSILKSRDSDSDSGQPDFRAINHQAQA